MPTVAEVVRRFGPAYLARYGATMPASHRRALRDLAACRTAACGGQVHACPACGYEHFVYHSCRNRHCPTCHGAVTAAWTAARTTELLPVPYFHVVFTLPAALRAIVRSHQRVLLAALMTTAAEALQTLARDPHYVGGTIAVPPVLPTWTRALVYHPHVHCLVPAGGLTADGTRWQPARGKYLVPVRALAARFRARFLTRLRRTLPHVALPPDLWRTPWVVYAKPAVQGPPVVLRYLARYVHRVAITDHRLVAVTRETVTFRYVDRRTQTPRTMTLPGAEFLRRFLQHVLPRGLHKVRYYGLWRPAAARTRARLQLALAPRSPASSVADALPTARPSPPPPCPHCAGAVLRIRRLPRVALPHGSGIPP